MDWRRTDDGRVQGTGVYIVAEVMRDDGAEDSWAVRIVPRTDGRQTRDFERKLRGFDSVEIAMREAERIEREDGPEIATQAY